jgi:GTP-binding protein HflX
MLSDEFSISREAKAILVTLVSPKFPEHATEADTKRSLLELRELMRTLGIEVVEEFIQNRQNVDPATIIGSGKLKEIAEFAEENEGTLLVFDCELTSSQIRNIKEITDLAVIDRVHVILEIFAAHAQTKEAKIQIEIARLQYVLPRLTGFWSHFSRQRGGVGVLGGEGEQQIELDRRIIRERIEFFKRELVEVQKSRVEQRKRRKDQAVTAALVGYTNAGKSSVMNRLCQVNILEENKLFATLDSTYRMLNPDTKPPMILIDTVGFISNLPNTLIDGFKTTLESALEADLLILVVDVSDPAFEKHIEVTTNVLKELGLEDKERMIVFNKKDILNNDMKLKIITRNYENSIAVSTYNPDDMKGLKKTIIDYFLSKQDHHDLFIPYTEGQAHAQIIAKTNVINQVHHETGIFYRIRTPKFIFENLGLKSFILGPDEERPAGL